MFINGLTILPYISNFGGLCIIGSKLEVIGGIILLIGLCGVIDIIYKIKIISFNMLILNMLYFNLSYILELNS